LPGSTAGAAAQHARPAAHIEYVNNFKQPGIMGSDCFSIISIRRIFTAKLKPEMSQNVTQSLIMMITTFSISAC
jgi:hypothetical protein